LRNLILLRKISNLNYRRLSEKMPDVSIKEIEVLGTPFY
jgi:hypothetical protein